MLRTRGLARLGAALALSLALAAPAAAQSGPGCSLELTKQIYTVGENGAVIIEGEPGLIPFLYVSPRPNAVQTSPFSPRRLRMIDQDGSILFRSGTLTCESPEKFLQVALFDPNTRELVCVTNEVFLRIDKPAHLCGDCAPCDGKITDLTLRYDGSDAAFVEVEQKDGDVVFADVVAPGASFAFSGTDKGTLGKEIELRVNGLEAVRIHTSCSKPIGVGAVFGEFTVVAGASRKGGALCPLAERCGCEGKVSELTLRYLGTTGAQIDVRQKKNQQLVFSGFVPAGGAFSFVGTDKGTLGTEIKLDVDGVEAVRIHTSCSKPIGIGSIFGDFEVLDGASKKGGPLCPVDAPPGGGGCGECDGKVTDLTLRYDGPGPARIEVEQKKNGDVVFGGVVGSGSSFRFMGTDKGTLGTEIILRVDGAEVQRIHTSCSKPIGIGSVFGDFTVVAGASKDGGPLCPADEPEGPGAGCGECDGKVTHLTLEYGGPRPMHVEVEQKKDGDIVFSGLVAAGGLLSFVGTDKGTLGTEIILRVDGVEVQRIHTSCSKPIGIGSVFGEFTVRDGASKDGGRLCPVDDPGGDGCGECDGKVTTLTLRYLGSLAGLLEVVQKKDDDVVFSGPVASGDVISFVGTDKGTLGTEIILSLDGVEVQRIHTSCSRPIEIGSVFGDFLVLDGASKNGGPFCGD